MIGAGQPILRSGEGRPLGQVPLDAIPHVRRELHWAVQAIEGVGRTLGEPEPNSQHIALRWNETFSGLETVSVAGRRAALLPASAEVAVIGTDDHVVARTGLGGRTLMEITDWVRGHFESVVVGSPEWTPVREDANSSPVGDGEPFGGATEAHCEVAAWYRSAALLLSELTAEEAGAAPLLCWPHHFDLASFINLDPDKAQYEGRSVNVGMSPGDPTYPQPYFYVVPHPALDPDDLPQLSAGSWHTEGWVGAVLSAMHVVAAGDAQQALVGSFIRGAFDTSKRQLGAD